MKNLKRIGILVMAIIMVLAMTITVFATDPATLTNGTVGDKENGVSNVIKVEKSLVFKNPTETSVYGPNITYSYSVTAGSTNKEITDSDGIHASTFAGLENATVSGPVTWSSSVKYNASPAGMADVKSFNITFDENEYTSAGVYRYVINETVAPVEKANAGVVDGTIANIRYLDVYVKNSTPAGTFKIYGYALFSSDNDINGSGETTTVAAAGKTTGFVAGDETGDGTMETADLYETINLTVSKTLVSDAGMNGNPFPFEVGITNSGIKTNVRLITKVGTLSDVEAGNGTEGDPISILTAESGMTVTDTSHSIKHADAVKYIGIPALTVASYTVKETNNVTGTTYESSYIIDNGEKSGAKNIEYDQTSETASLNASDKVDHKVVFTNELKLISPTGLVMRFAPYALILAAGIVILVIALKHRSKKDDED